ncbi:succinyl-CoA synthetase (ADP-forming) beta subunit [Archaeoglobus sulfaticallidus PM70-1]|uniref:Succinate--CoA ligase [ADP-forming] subunit beta n=1 Tax=Archaeoglobus sulfaticallidus PM70-1 TaxID=387631 RepID=N0BEU8_9EURY|nr:ADP-forming succinate--CoA ligase subunit beta [Archaeoglobus sulfaticallidus]AGK62169.1 succinyl-CoA synthetase (ADP-forming) beta subunit [Archaeoglobus sulfaticallidus PM70-1]
MKLYEYQAKEFFSKHGIKIPKSKLATDVNEVEEIAKELGKVVLKSQVLVGGRGKAGGILKAQDVSEAVEKAKELFGKDIKGFRVEKILVEEMLDIEREMYVGITLDRANKGIVIILSSVGGMDIEEIAIKHPDKISKKVVSPVWGLRDYQIRELLYESGMPKEYFKEVSSIIKKLYEIFVKYEAELTEINPLVVTRSGEILAADGRLNIDDNALYRQKEMAERRELAGSKLEIEAEEKGINYVKLDGNIGVIANGAGMSMSTMDLIYLEGGKPANFLDIGGGASAELVETSINLITSDPSVRVVFINIFGGITRCDVVAEGLIKAFNKIKIDIPVVLRLAGTNEEEGKEMIAEFMKSSDVKLYMVDTMEEGAKKAVELSGGV